jgi:hypothetical protein
MNRLTIGAAIIACCAACFAVHADYSVVNKGTWPTNWPKELEPLRAQSRTLEGPLAPNQHYAIPFTSRKDFESAWPHLLKVKSKESRLLLTRGPNFFLGEKAKAGVVVHSPPGGQPDNPAVQVGGLKGGLSTTYIELIVDGEIVDLNRIPLPADTPIVDDRFKERKTK